LIFELFFGDSGYFQCRFLSASCSETWVSPLVNIRIVRTMRIKGVRTALSHSSSAHRWHFRCICLYSFPSRPGISSSLISQFFRSCSLVQQVSQQPVAVIFQHFVHSSIFGIVLWFLEQEESKLSITFSITFKKIRKTH
jgi:hypothetical protein